MIKDKRKNERKQEQSLAIYLWNMMMFHKGFRFESSLQPYLCAKNIKRILSRRTSWKYDLEAIEVNPAKLDERKSDKEEKLPSEYTFLYKRHGLIGLGTITPNQRGGSWISGKVRVTLYGLCFISSYLRWAH